jgi:hypothetical protein
MMIAAGSLQCQQLMPPLIPACCYAQVAASLHMLHDLTLLHTCGFPSHVAVAQFGNGFDNATLCC